MTMNPYPGAATRQFRAGDRIRIKSKEEIFATLDAHGEIEGMPFMPEMLRFCGKSFVISKRADKACDTAHFSGLRQLDSTVHLDNLRCDGASHGGCQNNCLLFWREEWITSDPADDEPSTRPSNDVRTGQRPSAITEATLDGATIAESERDDRAVRYSCQATRLRAASAPMSPLDVSQYYRDVVSGNTSLRKVIVGLLIAVFNRYQDASRRLLPAPLLFRRGRRYPFIEGVLDRTPTESIGLQPGDIVRIKSKEEIVATLDRTNRNRGLTFDAEMVKYCGRIARVKTRVERVIDEATGEMLDMKTGCVILDNVVCDSDFHRFCPRSIYPFWREIWLSRV